MKITLKMYLDEDDGHGVEIEYDEHIWTSPVNAKKLAGVLAEVLDRKIRRTRPPMRKTARPIRIN